MKIKEKNVSLKRILPLLLALVLIAGLMPATAFAGGASGTPVPFGEVYWNPDPEFRASGNTHVTIRAERWVNVPSLGYMWLPVPAFDLMAIYRYNDTQNRTPQMVRILQGEPGYDPNIPFFRPDLTIPTSMLEAGDRIIIRRHHYIDDANYPSLPSEWTHFQQHNFYVPATTHPISFEPGLGSGTMATVNVAPGLYTLPTNGFTAPTTPPGRTFNGWLVGGNSPQAGDTLLAGAQITVNGAVTLTAQWTAGVGSHDVSFVANGGGSTMAAVSVFEGQTFNLPANGFTAPTTPPGRSFIGWIVSGNTPQADATELRQAGFTITVNGPVTVTAQWSAGEWPVSFEPGLGSGTMATVNVAPGLYTLPANGFTAPTTPPGRTFNGWLVGGNSPQAGDTLLAGAQITVNGAVTLTAQWTAGVGSHDVSFAANGGGGVMAAVPVFEGQTFNLPSNGFTAPTAPLGRQFTGWIVSGNTPQADATELRQAGFTITVNGPVTVTAQWSAGEWPISFDPGAGSGTMATVNVAPGTYTLPANGFTAPTTPPGRTFDGWAISGGSPEAGTTLQIGDTITVNGAVTLTAQWTAGVGAHNVSFAANGGGGTMTAESVYEGLTFTLPANAFTPPTAPLGRQFTGWIVSGNTPQADATELRQAGFTITVNGPVTVTAQWTVGEWPISFDPGTGSGTMATVNVAPGTYTLPNYGFTAPTTPLNRTFAGWEISGGSPEAGTTLQVGNTITVNGAVTLTAQWTIGGWPVAFAPGVGSGTMATVIVPPGTYGLPANGFTAPTTPANRIFAGWAISGGSPEAGTTLQIGDLFTVNGSVTLTAQWTAGDGTPYDVNFDPGLGSGTMAPMTVTAGDIFPLPVNGFTAPTTPPGRQFIGWIVSGDTPEADATELRPAGFPITIEGSVTLTAHWSAGEWPVTFAPGLGSGTMATVNVTDGATFNLPANGFTAPTTPANRTFAGWIVSGDTPEAHATMLRQAGFTITVNGPVTLTAQWTAGGTFGGPGGPTGGGGGGTTVIDDTDTPRGPFITDHTVFISGFPDGSIQPNREITRAEVSMILWRLLDSNAKHAPQAARFQDVQATAWHAQAINYLASRDIVTGFPDGNFRPNAPITRAELTAIMSRFFELNDNGVSDFSDVANTHWAIAYINNANNRGWVTGFADGTFRPNNATTRAEAVTLMNRVLERTPNPVTIDYHLNDIQVFSDLTQAHWAFYQIMEAAIEHDFYFDAQGLEVWENVVLPTR